VSRKQSSATWLPTSEQIAMASERAILASLDANLQLAVRALLAEHPSLSDDSSPEEPEPPHLALATSIRILAETLHELIAGYRAVIEHALGDTDPDDEF
jgi:hypothetical protein